MHAPDTSSPAARRELVLVVAILVALARLVGPPGAFAVAALIPVVVLLAGVKVLGGDASSARTLEPSIVPAVLAGGSAAAIHLVPVGPWIIVALVAFAMLFDRAIALEQRLLHQATGTSDGDRARVLLLAVATAFVAFTGVAALVPGGIAQPGGTPAVAAQPLTETALVVLALGDALVALLLGYRISAFRYGSVAEAARSALTYGLVIAIAAGAIRAVDLPRLVGPAVLTLVFYLWDAQHGSAPARRREPRFVWEMLLLAALAVVVLAWNLRLRV